MIRAGGGSLTLRTDTYDLQEISGIRVENLFSFTVLNPLDPPFVPPPNIPALLFFNRENKTRVETEYIELEINNLLFPEKTYSANIGGSYITLNRTNLGFRNEPAYGTLVTDYPFPPVEPPVILPIKNLIFENSPAYAKLTTELITERNFVSASGAPLILKPKASYISVKDTSEWVPAVIKIWNGSEWVQTNYRIWDGSGWVNLDSSLLI